MQMEPRQNPKYWLGKLSNLNIATTKERGKAPHKPLLLLTVMDLIESGFIKTPNVDLSPVLAQQFRDYWELVYERQRNRANIKMPFHALGGKKDAIWTCYTHDGLLSIAQTTSNQCEIDKTLWQCLNNEEFRRDARELLIARFFTSPERVLLSSRLGFSIPGNGKIEKIRKNAYQFKLAQKKGRDSRFKSDVLNGYYHTCALTGYRLDTLDYTLVEAAHIHQHAESGNDNPTNGLALTPNAHALFDQGLWSLEHRKDQFLIRIAGEAFAESRAYDGRGDFRLCDLDKKPMVFHPQSRLRPDSDACAWHFKERFVG